MVQCWPKSKPIIQTQFFEKDTKFPEKFVATLSDYELHKVALSGEGATAQLAMEALQKNLLIWMLNFRLQEIDHHFKERAAADAYHARLLKATEDLSPPKE